MTNSASLGQVTKILSLLEGIPSEQVQKVIESGYLASAVRTGNLDEVKGRENQKQLENSWRLISRLTKFEGIIITVPHDKCEHRSREKTVFQLRCWEGKHGYLKRGHVDGGVDLFEIMLPQPLAECDCCWKNTIQSLGLAMHDTDEKEWVKEVIMAQDRSKHDVITFRPRKQS